MTFELNRKTEIENTDAADRTGREGGLRFDRLGAALTRNILLIASVTVITTAVAVLKAVIDKPLYSSQVELLTPSASSITRLISALNPETLSQLSELTEATNNETKLKILMSPRLINPVVEELEATYPELNYQSVVSNLNITPSEQGSTLNVQFVGESPEKVTAVLNAISAAYLEYSLEDRQTDISRGIDFVEDQLPVVQARVQELEQSLESLRQQNNLIDPQSKGNQLAQQITDFTGDQLELRVQIEQTQALYQELQQELAARNEQAVASILSDSDRYQALLDQLVEVDSELAKELTLYLEDSPEIEIIQEQRANLQPLIEREGNRVSRELAAYITELTERDSALSYTIQTLNQQIQGMSSVTREYNEIQRGLEIATTSLNQFLNKREALRIDAAQRQTPWEILTPVSDPQISVASTKRNLGTGIVLGLFLGSGAAILVEQLRGKIHSIQELKEVTRLPLLGRIPHLSSEINSLINSDLDQHSPLEVGSHLSLPAQSSSEARFLEAFGILATNLKLISPDQPIRSVTVSSDVPNAGKSTVSLHLARACASTGQKTLLIDGDLRRPSLHEFCNVSNERGLSNFATGEFEIEEVVVKLPVENNLFLLPSGPVPPNAIKILSSNRLQGLFENVYREYDIVIFDTPPLLGFADTYIVTKETQGLLLVARVGQTKLSQLRGALDELSVAKVPVIGMVANSALVEKDSYDYLRYPYSQRWASSEQPLRPEILNNGSSSKQPTSR